MFGQKRRNHCSPLCTHISLWKAWDALFDKSLLYMQAHICMHMYVRDCCMFIKTHTFPRPVVEINSMKILDCHLGETGWRWVSSHLGHITRYKPYYWTMSTCVLSYFSHVWLCEPIDSSSPGSSVHGILQPKILEWVAMPSFKDLPDPGIEPVSLRSPALAAECYLGRPSIPWVPCR